MEYCDEKGGTFPLLCTVMKGKKNGPTLWIQGGLHGDEYDGPAAVLKLIESLDLQKLAGTVIAIPVVNYTAFDAIDNMSPLDGVNLNRVFPGDIKGTFSYRYGSWLFGLITKHANYHIDLHGGGRFLDVCRFAMIASTNTSADEISCSMAYCCGADYVYINTSTKGTLYCALTNAGIPSILLENGGGMSWSTETVSKHIFSVMAIMNYLGMAQFTGKLLPPGKVISKATELRFECEGLQTDYIQIGQVVTRGTQLITVVDIKTGEKHTVYCPIDKGIVLSIHTAASVKKGTYAAMLGEI
jgi:Predicted deacylase